MVSDEEADVVVTGSGMGGLFAARAIARFGGRRVLVLEQHCMRECVSLLKERFPAEADAIDGLFRATRGAARRHPHVAVAEAGVAEFVIGTDLSGAGALGGVRDR